MQKTSEWLYSYSSKVEEAKVRYSRAKAETISITGGKGGVGKTSISLKIARDLAEQGYKVLLIDCDTNLSNTAIKLGLPLQNKFFSLVSAERSFDDCLYKEGLFHLLSASNGCIDLFNSSFKLEEFIIDIMTAHESEYDYILLDCPAGLQRDSLILSAYCNKRIMVVNPDRSSITDTYSLIKLLKTQFGIKENHLIINKYETTNQLQKVVKTLSETVENFLEGRTILLGGIKKLEGNREKFDADFFAGGKISLQKNFDKVIKKLTDELGTPGRVVNTLFTMKPGILEQEVR